MRRRTNYTPPLRYPRRYRRRSPWMTLSSRRVDPRERFAGRAYSTRKPPHTCGRPSAEFRDRMAGYADLGLDRLSRQGLGLRARRAGRRALRDLEVRLGRRGRILEEPALAEIEESTRRLLEDIRERGPVQPALGRRLRSWRAAATWRAACSSPTSSSRPGVAYGVSSAFILEALEENGRGTLHSVDLPPLRTRVPRGSGVSPCRTALRGRWSLHRGSSRRVLPRLLQEVGTGRPLRARQPAHPTKHAARVRDRSGPACGVAACSLPTTSRETAPSPNCEGEIQRSGGSSGIGR